jgi:hypothetical protein
MRGGANDDAELAVIEDELRETASFAVDPAFKKRLQGELLEEFRDGSTL